MMYDDPDPEKKSWFISPTLSEGRKRHYLRNHITVISTGTHRMTSICGQNVATPVPPTAWCAGHWNDVKTDNRLGVTIHTVLMADLNTVTVDGYRATTDVTVDGHALLAPRSWLRCAPADVEIVGAPDRRVSRGAATTPRLNAVNRSRGT
jgi:hypothetical protein